MARIHLQGAEQSLLRFPEAALAAQHMSQVRAGFRAGRIVTQGLSENPFRFFQFSQIVEAPAQPVEPICALAPQLKRLPRHLDRRLGRSLQQQKLGEHIGQFRIFRPFMHEG
jgi:hypothetical protein